MLDQSFYQGIPYKPCVVRTPEGFEFRGYGRENTKTPACYMVVADYYDIPKELRTRVYATPPVDTNCFMLVPKEMVTFPEQPEWQTFPSP